MLHLQGAVSLQRDTVLNLTIFFQLPDFSNNHPNRGAQQNKQLLGKHLCVETHNFHPSLHCAVSAVLWWRLMDGRVYSVSIT